MEIGNAPSKCRRRSDGGIDPAVGHCNDEALDAAEESGQPE